MRTLATLSLAVAATLAVPALAEEPRGPTTEQLMQRPPASEIVSRWVTTCVENAGDGAAQRRTGQQIGLDWPYQLITRDNTDIGDTCVLISTVAAADSNATLETILEASLRARGLRDIVNDGEYLAGELTIAGRPYRVIGNIDQQPGEPLPTAVVVLATASRSAR